MVANRGVACERARRRSHQADGGVGLRHALNVATCQDRLLDFNPAAVVELAAAVRPKPVIWTEEKAARWRKDHAEHLGQLKRAREGKRVDPIAAHIGTPIPSSRPPAG